MSLSRCSILAQSFHLFVLVLMHTLCVRCVEMHLQVCTCVSVSVNMDVHHMCVHIHAQVRGEPRLMFLRSHKYYF